MQTKKILNLYQNHKYIIIIELVSKNNIFTHYRQKTFNNDATI
jgi:hypothetical protein